MRWAASNQVAALNNSHWGQTSCATLASADRPTDLLIEYVLAWQRHVQTDGAVRVG